MNDFSELERELRALRPADPSPILYERVEQALANSRASGDEQRSAVRRWGSLQVFHPWLSWGFGLAAAAVLVLLAAISMERAHKGEEFAQTSRPAETQQFAARPEGSRASNEFIPASATRLVYNTRDEGLQFPRSGEPLRRVRYQTRETWQWRNPNTGASLRVSYPSEEVVLIPVSGQ